MMTKDQLDKLNKYENIVTELEKFGIVFLGVDGNMVITSYQGKRLCQNIMTWQEFSEEEIIKMVKKSFFEKE